MVELLSVYYYDNNSYTSKYFSMNEKRKASTLARTSSKNTGKRSQIFKCKGLYTNEGFYTIEASNLAIYEDGKKK